MKVYLCTSCKQTVPLNELAAHRESCSSELAIEGGTGQDVGGRVMRVLLALVLAAVGVWLGFRSFSAVQSMRQLERIPATEVHAVLPGEVNLSGKAQKLKKTFKAPKSKTNCLYYRYVVEKQERDSDGDTTWRTVKRETKRANFFLRDESGTIRLIVAKDIDFSLPESYETRQGDYRYTEWRIDPGDEIFVFGSIVEEKKGEHVVRFDVAGDYEPVISKYGEASERSDMASASLLQCWGSLLLLAFAVGFLIRACGVHRLLVFFAILSAVIMMSLTVQGTMMIVEDLRAGVTRLERHKTTATALIKEDLGAVGVAWNGDWDKLGNFADYAQLPADQAARLRRIRLDLALAATRVREQRATFPENVVAALAGVRRKVALPLPLPEADKIALAGMAGEFAKARLSGLMAMAMVGGGLLIGIPSLLGGFKRVRHKRCMENVPTSKTSGAVYGLTELKGIVEPAEDAVPYSAPLSHLPSTFYTYKVERKKRSGKKTKWVTVSERSQRCDFRCRDADGSIDVSPEGAEIYTCHHLVKREGPLRYTETRLEVGDPLYVIGTCAVNPKRADELYLCKPDDGLPFIISNQTEATVVRKLAGSGVAMLNLAFGSFLLIGLTAFGLFGSFGADDYLTAAMLAPLFMLFMTLVLHFNDLVFLRQRVKRNASNIDVALKKRSDLVPNFAAIVKSYMTHEHEVMQAITNMRTSYQARDPNDPASMGAYLEAEQQAAVQVLARMEAYPELKADRDAGALMRLLVSLENEVAAMREGYNHAVEVYNTRIATLPDAAFAKLGGFAEYGYIQIDADDRALPSMQELLGEGGVLAESSETDEQTEASAQVYALLVNPEADVREKQLATIQARHGEPMAQRCAALVAELDNAGPNDLERLLQAEAQYDQLVNLDGDAYRTFGIVVRELMEAEGIISLFESVLQASLATRLDGSRKATETAEVWYQDMESAQHLAGIVLSALAHQESDVEATAAGAFATGVAALGDDLEVDMLAAADCDLSVLNLALTELRHGSEDVRRTVYAACEACIIENDDFTVEQALLMGMIADALRMPRPSWIGDA